MVISPKDWEYFPFCMSTLGIFQPHWNLQVEASHNMQKYDKKSLHSLSNQIQTFLNFELKFLKSHIS